jgi:hypothetical protein
MFLIVHLFSHRSLKRIHNRRRMEWSLGFLPYALAPPSHPASTYAAPCPPVGTPVPLGVHRAAVSSPRASHAPRFGPCKTTCVSCASICPLRPTSISPLYPLPRGLADAPCTVHLPLRPQCPSPRWPLLRCTLPASQHYTESSHLYCVCTAHRTYRRTCAGRLHHVCTVSPLPVAPPLALCPHR